MKRSLLGLMMLILWAAPGLSADSPPRDLRLAGDHWTAWDPPTEFPQGAELHVIEVGDTLWDLASRFYGDAYLWPQLWERNRYILDAHWIYPGDPLIVDVEVVPMEQVAGLPVDDGEPREDQGKSGVRLGTANSAPVPLGNEADIYCSGYLGPVDESFGYSIVGSEYGAMAPTLSVRSGGLELGYGRHDTVKVALSDGDIVYLDGGRAGGLAPGSQFTVVHPEEVVRHPASGDVVGRLYRYEGRIRVLSVQEQTAIGEVIHACDGVLVGAFLQPFEPEPIPLARRTPVRPVNYPAAASSLVGSPVIVESNDRVVSLGQGHLVYIDHGSNQDVVPGDLFTIYRRNRDGLPPVVIGELAVLSVQPDTAVARILESRFTVYVGDLLDPK